jgi:peptidyl-prolyl cis-trans isomerase SurA
MSGFTQTNEPIIMTIKDKPVYKSEFENVFKKNNGRDFNKEPKSLREYLDLYSIFKIKVFEAEAKGLDTNSTFRNELSGYRTQLAAPYLTDKNVNDGLVNEAYDRMKSEVKAQHILIQIDEAALPKDTIEAYTKLSIIRDYISGKTISNARMNEYESILKKSSSGLTKKSSKKDSADFNKKLNAIKYLNQISSNSSDKFSAVAKVVSEDPSAVENGGDLGYFTSLQMVYPFENAAYNTKVGEISAPIRTRFGYHILKVNDKRPYQGEILTAHIMVAFNKESTENEKANLKTKIDEIYSKLKAGEKFEDLARQFSDDKQSAERGGQIQWFGSSRLPIEFEKAAFGLQNNGDYSEPFATKYGWHIVKRLDKKGLASFDETKNSIKQRISKDSRTISGTASLIARLKKEYNFKENKTAKDEFLKVIDSTIYQGKWVAEKSNVLGNKELFSFGNKKITQNDFSKFIEKQQTNRPKIDNNVFLQQSYKAFVDETIINYENANLESKYPEFRNIIREYRDGILLFDITDKEVWSKAIKDTIGLKSFYEKNKNNYLWEERAEVTSYICLNEKVAKEVRALLIKNKTEKEILEKINKTSQLNLSAESVTYLKGEDKNVDANWKKGITANDIKDSKENKIIVLVTNNILPISPKTLPEARGTIAADYQSYLEKEWLASLKNKYIVKVNEEVLNSLKQ